MKKIFIYLALFCMSAGIYHDTDAKSRSRYHKKSHTAQAKDSNATNRKPPSKYLKTDRYKVLESISHLAIDIVTPASGVPANFYSKNKATFDRFKIKVPPEALINKELHSFANTDENRLDQLVKAINNPNSDVIWTMRGGFGSYKLIKSLKDMPKPTKKKYFVGYSDITALNLFISQNWEDWTVIHGPVFREISVEEFNYEDWSLLVGILEGGIKDYKVSRLQSLNKKTASKLQGKLTGGNLSLIEQSLDTCWEIQTEGKILFIEDCGESGPSIYRSLYHLKEVGKFDGVVAIVFGHFKGCVNFVENLKAFAEEINIPVFMTDKFGHGKHNVPIVYNAQGTIEGNTLKVNLEK